MRRAFDLKEKRSLPEKGYLFVYGTLLSGVDPQKNASLLADADFIGEGSVNGVLYDLVHFPAMIVSSKSYERVFGEVYEFEDNPEFFSKLDHYEGYDPKSPQPYLFRRCQTEVHLGDGRRLRAWVLSIIARRQASRPYQAATIENLIDLKKAERLMSAKAFFPGPEGKEQSRKNSRHSNHQILALEVYRISGTHKTTDTRLLA